MTKKVLFVSHTSNFIKFNLPYLKWFADQDFEVHYASAEEEPLPDNCCDKHFKVPFNRSPYNLKNIKAYLELKKIIAKENYSIIHCHTPMGGVITRLAARKARKHGTKVIYTVHGFHFYEGASWVNWAFFYPVEKLLSYFTDCIITINEEDYQRACRKFHAKSTQKIDGVGVDLSRFAPSNALQRVSIREKNHFNNQQFILICIAEFIDRKNHQFVFHTIKKLKQKIPDIQIVFAGIGENLDKFVELSKSSDLEEIVRFVGYRSDINELCLMSDVLISASKQEGLPINVIEGMATGLPVVCTDIRGHNDIIKNGINGFLYALDNEDEFIDYVLTLYKNPALIKEMSMNNINIVQLYSLERALSHMGEIYQQYM